MRQLFVPPANARLPDEVRDSPAENTMESQSAFAYVTSEVTDRVEATVGLSFGDFEQSSYSASEVDPKIGLRVELAEDLALRAAYAETLARPLILDQTVEPTTIAGFDQFYDDFAGAAAKLAAVGVDARARPNLWIGAAATRRWIDTPVEDTERRALLHRGDPRDDRRRLCQRDARRSLGLSLEARHEQFRLEEEDFDLPDTVDTTLVPLSVRWFGESGLFTSIDASYVHQSLTEPRARRAPGRGSPRRLGRVSAPERPGRDHPRRWQPARPGARLSRSDIQHGAAAGHALSARAFAFPDRDFRLVT